MAGAPASIKKKLKDKVPQNTVAFPSKIGVKRHSLNETHAVVMLGGRCVVLNEIVEPTFGRKDIDFSSIPDFKHRYANNRVMVTTQEGNTKSISIAKLWIEWEDRRQYDGIVFSPAGDVNGYYNLYRGLTVEPKKGKWPLLQKHIHDVICSGDEGHYQYLMTWLADAVQNPGGDKPGTAIVLKGKKGTGKGCFVSAFGKIFGNHFLQITNPSHLTGRFNQHLKDAIVVFADECFFAGDKTAEGVLKGMITEPEWIIEPKGKDSFTVKNHVRLIVASNEDWIVPAGPEERRFFVLDVSDIGMQKAEYFKPLWGEIENGGRAAFLYDLLKWDISKINLRQAPKTNALFSQIEETMDPVGKFWFEKLRCGTITYNNSEWTEYAITTKLYDEYILFCNNIGKQYKLAPNSFSRKLRDYAKLVVRKQIINEYNKREWALFFDTLEACRMYFEAKIGMKLDWNR